MKNNTGLVSIIVPIYKVEEYIEECIRSVMAQTYPQVEVILVDDVGEDKSTEMAENLLRSSHFPWQTVRHTRNRGLSAARNSGVDVARGEFIYFLDSDDWISPSCIERLVESALKYQSQVVSGNFCDHNVDGSIAEKIRDYPQVCDAPLAFYVDRRNLSPSMSANRLIRKDFYSSTGIEFCEGIYYEDEPWTFWLMSKATRVSFIKDVTYYYRRRVGSITVNQKLNFFRINSRYYHLRHCTKLFTVSDILNIKGVREWFARVICNFMNAVVASNLTRDDKVFIFNKMFAEVYIPRKELNRMTFYMFSILRKLSIILPSFRWVDVLMLLQNLKRRCAS